MASRRRSGLLLALPWAALIGLTLAACPRAERAPAPAAESAPRESETEAATKQESAMLKCRAQPSEGRLDLRVEVQNDTAGSLWVATALPRQSGSKMKMDPFAAYVEVQAGEVAVGQWLVAIPDGVSAEAPEVPAWTRLDPGQTYAGQMTVGWPLVRRWPYPTPGKAETVPASPAWLWCQVGVVPAKGDENPPDYGQGVLDRQMLLRRRVDLSDPSPPE